MATVIYYDDAAYSTAPSFNTYTDEGGVISAGGGGGGPGSAYLKKSKVVNSIRDASDATSTNVVSELALAKDRGGRYLGHSETFAGLPMSKGTRLGAFGDFALLTKDSGTKAAGFYVLDSGLRYVFDAPLGSISGESFLGYHNDTFANLPKTRYDGKPGLAGDIALLKNKDIANNKEPGIYRLVDVAGTLKFVFVTSLYDLLDDSNFDRTVEADYKAYKVPSAYAMDRYYLRVIDTVNELKAIENYRDKTVKLVKENKTTYAYDPTANDDVEGKNIKPNNNAGNGRWVPISHSPEVFAKFDISIGNEVNTNGKIRIALNGANLELINVVNGVALDSIPKPANGIWDFTKYTTVVEDLRLHINGVAVKQNNVSKVDNSTIEINLNGLLASNRLYKDTYIGTL